MLVSLCEKFNVAYPSALKCLHSYKYTKSMGQLFLSPHNTHGIELNICNT